VNRYKAEHEAQANAELEKQGKYKERLAAEKKKRVDAELELSNFRKERETAIKTSALFDGLGGRIEQKYWPLLDEHVAKIAFDTETNTIDEASVTESVESIKTLFPDIMPTKQGVNLPNQAAQPPQGQLTYEQWLKLPYAEKKQRQNEVID